MPPLLILTAHDKRAALLQYVSLSHRPLPSDFTATLAPATIGSICNSPLPIGLQPSFLNPLNDLLNCNQLYHPAHYIALMAVLDTVPGLEVQVVVRDQPLHEYEDCDVHVPKDTIERYVEAQTNANFEIRYSFAQPFPTDRAVSMLITIDGNDVDEPLLRPSELFDIKGHTSSGPVYKSGLWKVRKYRFRGIRIGKEELGSR